MLLELPIELINKKESEIVGDEGATVKPGILMIRVDCIQAIHENELGSTILETNTGSTYMILIPYDDMRQIWHKALDTIHSPFIIRPTKQQANENKKNIPGIPRSNEPVPVADPVGPVESCENCGGLNFDIISESGSLDEPKSVTKICKDCGVSKI